jgi:hypothetical protein
MDKLAAFIRACEEMGVSDTDYVIISVDNVVQLSMPIKFKDLKEEYDRNRIA